MKLFKKRVVRTKFDIYVFSKRPIVMRRRMTFQIIYILLQVITEATIEFIFMCIMDMEAESIHNIMDLQ